MGYAWKKETREMYVYVSRLRKSGLTGDSLKKAIAAVKGAARTNAPVKIPKAVRDEIGIILARGERAVVTQGKKGTVKTYTMDGYGRLVEKGRHAANKKWENNGAATEAPRRRRKAKKMRKYVHWTHRPENADKLAKVKANLKYARDRAKAAA